MIVFDGVVETWADVDVLRVVGRDGDGLTTIANPARREKTGRYNICAVSA